MTRITVDGSDNANDHLRVSTHEDGRLTWVTVPFTS